MILSPLDQARIVGFKPGRNKNGIITYYRGEAKLISGEAGKIIDIGAFPVVGTGSTLLVYFDKKAKRYIQFKAGAYIFGASVLFAFALVLTAKFVMRTP